MAKSTQIVSLKPKSGSKSNKIIKLKTFKSRPKKNDSNRTKIGTERLKIDAQIGEIHEFQTFRKVVKKDRVVTLPEDVDLPDFALNLN